MVQNDEPVERLFTQGMVIKDAPRCPRVLEMWLRPTRWCPLRSDAARLYSLFAAPPDRDLDWQDKGLKASSDSWVGSIDLCRGMRSPNIRTGANQCPQFIDRSTRHSTQAPPNHQACERRLQGRWHFNTCVAAIMELVNELYGMTIAAQVLLHPRQLFQSRCSPRSSAISRSCSRLCALPCPRIVGMLGEETSLLRAPWPKYDPALAKEEEIEIPVQINGKLRSRIVVPADANEDVLRERALADEKIRVAIAGKQVVKVIVVPASWSTSSFDNLCLRYPSKMNSHSQPWKVFASCSDGRR